MFCNDSIAIVAEIQSLLRLVRDVAWRSATGFTRGFKKEIRDCESDLRLLDLYNSALVLFFAPFEDGCQVVVHVAAQVPQQQPRGPLVQWERFLQTRLQAQAVVLEDFVDIKSSNILLSDELKPQDPTLLEFAWLDLLEGNKSVTVKELTENLLKAIVHIYCYQEMKFTSQGFTAKALVRFMVPDQLFRRNLLNVLDFLKRPNASALVSGTRDRVNLHDKFKQAIEAYFPRTIDELTKKVEERKADLEKPSFWDSVKDSNSGALRCLALLLCYYTCGCC
ncbi:hypothetical protein SSX86_030235 [Deinandra increscens subsp. villosa]|uniref:Uncharacterized protein n=1 Tax=Deinandra increscens subsp. villosa TaxID=3103831 RepID=A0AAP0CBY5_9ASTR